MSDQQGYVKDEELPRLTRNELIEKVRTARGIWRSDQKTIESLTSQCVELSEQLKEGATIDDQISEKIAKLESEIKIQDNTITGLQVAIQERDEQIEALLAKLEELCTPIAVACRQIGEAKEMLRPYWKKPTNNGGAN